MQKVMLKKEFMREKQSFFKGQTKNGNLVKKVSKQKVRGRP
jgi:hypothetical protein